MKNAFRRLMRPLLERQLARLILRHKLKVVAVAGSVGKTSTKMAIASVLAQKYRVRVHSGNYNDTVSVPLAAFLLEVPAPIMNPLAWLMRLVTMERMIWSAPTCDVLVLELGTDHPGELAHFMSYLKPDLGVVTAIAPEHMEFFKTIEAVAEEEFTLAHGAKQAVLNDHFDRIHPFAKNLKPSPLWYSASTLKKYEAKLTRDHHWDTTQWPAHIKQALGAAIVVAEQLKLNESQILSGLGTFGGVPGRMQRLAGQGGSVIIDDTYNSSPDAVTAALDYLYELPVTGRRIAILGSMNELGDGSPKYHADLGPAASGLDLLVTIGTLANDHLGPAAVAAGLDPTRFKPADSPYAAGEYVRLIMRPGDVVLAKGSQNGVFAEEAIKALLVDPSDASKLVRQSPAWLAKKRSQFADAGTSD
jgi:UDP-N-acetylmuramoyl-tripeptide--D-alanyl-D-alanine ligase